VPLGIAAATGVVLLTIGATITHLRAGDTAPRSAPAVVVLALAAATLTLSIGRLT
jgi:hypothetical protein